MPTPPNDQYWMQLAMNEARKGVGLTSPNPPVGAVITRDNEAIGKGWHCRAGEPHAEREAIADALTHHSEDALKEATIYVTLEPCSSHGRTPPCTQGILDAGISRVVYGAEDPNPDHSGRAREVFESAGVQVTGGVCEHDCRKLIRPFAKVQQSGMPWVILKSAISLDGHITRPQGESQWLSSAASREAVQQLRFQADAIITGGNTLRADNPALTLRSAKLPPKPQPWRMVITRANRASLPTDAKLFTDDYAERTLVQEEGDIPAALKRLADKGCNSVLVEAGGRLMGAFLDANLADELAIFYAPMLTGGPDVGFAGPAPGVNLHEQHFSRIGDDILLRATVKHD